MIASADEEVQAVSKFLCQAQPESFKPLSSGSIETDTREAMVLASVVPEAFFLKRRGKLVEPYQVQLGREFASKWIQDVRDEYGELFSGSRKEIKFFTHWVPEKDYSGRGAEYRRVRRESEMHQVLSKEVEDSGKNLSDVLFVPLYSYARGNQLRESIFHYIAGLVFRNMGYLVVDEYTPVLLTGTARTPDLSAFRTPEMVEMMGELRRRGIISRGAFVQELQLYGVFGKLGTSSAPTKDLTDAEVVAVEVKRCETQFQVKVGARQIQDYVSEAFGLYEEGYLSGPFISGEGTVSMDREGALKFERPPPSTTTADTDYWKERKIEQLRDVRASVVQQLLKGRGLLTMVKVCDRTEDLQTYGNLMKVLEEISVDEALERV